MNYQKISDKSARLFVNKVDELGGVPDEHWSETFLQRHVTEGRATRAIEREMARLDMIREAILELCARGDARDPDAEEGRLSAQVHAALLQLPIEVLDDEGFWQYLAIRFFREFIVWREHKALEKGNIATYFLANRNTEQIPLRMFLRGQIAEEGGDYGLAVASEKDTDLWRSHIIRVSTGYSGTLAKSLLRSHAKFRMTTAVLRPFAKRLNRHWTNRDLYLLDRAACDSLIAEERAFRDSAQTAVNDGGSDE